MSETRFYICEHCGNIIGKINDSGVPVVCCGEKMKMLEPNTVDAAAEKHVPAVEVGDGCVSVTVGSIAHPMTEEHSIMWVYLKTEKGGQRKNLAPGDAPEVKFCFCDDKPVAVYAYCNLHGLWMKEL